MYYYFNPTYFLFMLPGLIIALWAQAKVKHNYSKYSKVISRRGMTGADVAAYIMRAHSINNVRVEHIRGHLTDNFDPRTNIINLSDGIYNGTSIAAIGVAAHEAGHAVQHAVGYQPIKVRMALVPICNFSCRISAPLIIVGYLLSYNYTGTLGQFLVWAGIALFSVAVLFQLVTLPVEFNASARAMEIIRSDELLDDDEAKGARKVLTAAAMTYVAALLQSVLTLLYYISRFAGNGRRR